MPVKIERKIFRVGYSSAISLLRGWLDGLDLKTGDVVTQFYDSILVIVPKKIDNDSLKEELLRLAESLKEGNPGGN